MVRKFFKLSAAAVALLFVGAQFVRTERPDAPLDPSRSIEARARLTPEVSALLSRSCNDCHTRQTRWPWYSRVAPVSWFVADHVRHGRSHLDLSDWASYETQDVDGILHGICGEARRGTMPLRSYTLLHRDAKLTPADVKTLCDWTQSERLRLASQN